MTTSFPTDSEPKITRPSVSEHASIVSETVPSEKQLKETGDKIQHEGPRLIFLTAPTSSGKSSIMAEFAKRENTEQLGTDDFEEIHFRPSLIAKHFPDQYAILSKVVDNKNLYNFLFLPRDIAKRFFKNSPEPTTDLEKQEREKCRQAALTIYDDDAFVTAVDKMLKENKPLQDEAHFKAILDHYANGKTVIFDSPNAVDFFKYLKSHPRKPTVERFLIFVPLTKLIERLPIRNEQAEKTGNLYNKRQYIDVLHQFMHHYHPTSSEDDVVVGTLKREDVEKIFKDHEETIKEENSKARDKARKDLVVEREQFLKFFGLDKSPEVAITSDYQKFDGIFHTALDSQTAAVSAKQLAERSWKKFKEI